MSAPTTGFEIEHPSSFLDSWWDRAFEGMRRNRWWITRLLALPFQLLGFAVAAFLLVRLIPGDPVRTATGNQATPEVYAEVQQKMGLDGSLWHQLTAYVGDLLHGDIGHSLLTGRSLTSEFAQRLPATLELAGMALFFVLLTTGIASYFAVIRPVRFVTPLIRGYARAAGSVPDFVIGVLGIFLFYATLHWSPAPLGRLSPLTTPPPSVTNFPFLDALLSGRVDVMGDMAWHLALPIAVLVVTHAAVVLKLLIGQLDEELHKPATLFRISSGASARVVTVSVYRRALPAAVTMAGTDFGYLISGAVIVESLFGFGGMGQYLVEALAGADLSAMQGFLIAIAAVCMVVFLLVDICNMLLDPRRRPGVVAEG